MTKFNETIEEYVVQACWAINEAQQKLNTSFGSATAHFNELSTTEQIEADIKKAEALIEMRKRQIEAVEFKLNIQRMILANGQHDIARASFEARWAEAGA